MTVGAVLVHYRTPGALSDCLDALSRQTSPPDELVVVDNGALPEDSGPEFPLAGWRWHAAGGNLGYAGAANLGATMVGGDALLVLNPDVRLEPGACEALGAALSRDPTHAVVAPRIIGSDGEIERNARQFPTPLTGVLGRASALTAILTRLGRVPRSLQPAGGVSAEVDWVSGACMMIRRSAFDEVGGFDERYWMYWEDADLCRRLSDRGWKILFEPEARAHHATGSSGRSARTVRAFHESAALYAATHMGSGRAGAAIASALLRIRMHVQLRRLPDGR